MIVSPNKLVSDCFGGAISRLEFQISLNISLVICRLRFRLSITNTKNYIKKNFKCAEKKLFKLRF